MCEEGGVLEIVCEAIAWEVGYEDSVPTAGEWCQDGQEILVATCGNISALTFNLLNLETIHDYMLGIAIK